MDLSRIILVSISLLIIGCVQQVQPKPAPSPKFVRSSDAIECRLVVHPAVVRRGAEMLVVVGYRNKTRQALTFYCDFLGFDVKLVKGDGTWFTLLLFREGVFPTALPNSKRSLVLQPEQERLFAYSVRANMSAQVTTEHPFVGKKSEEVRGLDSDGWSVRSFTDDGRIRSMGKQTDSWPPGKYIMSHKIGSSQSPLAAWNSTAAYWVGESNLAAVEFEVTE